MLRDLYNTINWISTLIMESTEVEERQRNQKKLM